MKMSRKSLILICALMALMLNLNFFHYAPLAQGEDEDIEAVKSFINTVQDFNVRLRVNGKEGNGTIVVDGTTIFDISKIGENDKVNVYKLYYFFDGRLRRIVDDISLPHKFTQTFRGLLEGSYEVGFVLRDSEGDHGSCAVTIDVVH